jgi:hypothetical protein
MGFTRKTAESGLGFAVKEGRGSAIPIT